MGAVVKTEGETPVCPLAKTATSMVTVLPVASVTTTFAGPSALLLMVSLVPLAVVDKTLVLSLVAI